MVDEVINNTSAPAASPAETPAEVAVPPSVETPVTPPVETIPASDPVKVDSPVEPQTEAPAEVTKPEEAKKAETLLAGEKKAEEKPAEIKPESKEIEVSSEVKTDEIAPLPVYEPFKLPEEVQFDEAKMGEFTKTLAEFEITSKAPHEEVQKLGQQLVDRHIEEINRYTESLTHAWNKQKTDWKDSFLKDPEFLNRTDTVINSAIDAIGVYGGDAKQQSEFRELMESTGVGNHPAMIRLLSNIMLAKAEPKPLAAPTIAPKAASSKIQKMYGKKSG